MDSRSVRWPNMGEIPQRRASWRHYDLLHTDNADFSLQCALDGTIVWATDDLCSLVGFSPTEMVGLRIETLVADDDIDKVRDSRALLDEGATFDETTVHLLDKDGIALPLALRTRPIHDNSGTLIGFLQSFEDLAEHSAILRALVTHSRCTSVLLRSTTRDELVRELCECIVTAGTYTLCWIGRANDDANHTVDILAHAGSHEEYVRELEVRWDDSDLGNGPTGRAIKSGETQVRNDVRESEDFHPWRAAARDANLVATIVIPIFTGDTTFGALVVYADEPGTFDALARGLFEDLGADLGFALAKLS